MMPAIQKVKILFSTLLKNLKYIESQGETLRGIFQKCPRDNADCQQASALSELLLSLIPSKKEQVVRNYSQVIGFHTGFACSFCEAESARFVSKHAGRELITISAEQCRRSISTYRDILSYRELLLKAALVFSFAEALVSAAPLPSYREVGAPRGECGAEPLRAGPLRGPCLRLCSRITHPLALFDAQGTFQLSAGFLRLRRGWDRELIQRLVDFEAAEVGDGELLAEFLKVKNIGGVPDKDGYEFREFFVVYGLDGGVEPSKLGIYGGEYGLGVVVAAVLFVLGFA